MLTSDKNLIIAFFTVLVVAFSLNMLNVSCIRKQTDTGNEFLNKNLVYNQTIFSIDNSWYLPQIHNFLAGKGFTCDTTDPRQAVRRTPVYPMFYGIHYLLFGEKKSFFAIKTTQTFLFALSAIALLLAAFHLSGNRKIAWLSYLLYGFNPTLISYTYYTVTESLAPALICFMLYFFAKSIRFHSVSNWLLTGIFFSLASLCRPTVFIFGGSVAITIIILYRNDLRKMLKMMFAFGFAVCLLFVPYIIRNYKVSGGDIVILEKYYDDPMGYGMQNIELRKWIATWMNPADYNSERISNKMIDNIRFHRPKENLLDSLIRTIPSAAYTSYRKETVADIYQTMYGFYEYKFTPGANKNTDSAEMHAVQNIRKHKEHFIQNHPLKYYIVTPLLFMKSIILQSNSATICYLDNYRSNKFVFFIKMLLVLLNVFLFFSLAGNLLHLKKHFIFYIATLFFVAINIGYLLFVLNYFEARYLIPLFPLMYISAAIFAVESFDSIRYRLNL